MCVEICHFLIALDTSYMEGAHKPYEQRQGSSYEEGPFTQLVS